jgi:RNA polymerase sigma factor (sigma-70 family)
MIVGRAQILNRSTTMRESSPEQWAEADFRAVFLLHYSRIVGILVRLLGDHAQAEEIANDTFLRLYCQRGLQTSGNVGGWIYRTATNLGIDSLRASTRRRRHEESAGRLIERTTDGTPLDDLMRRERCQRVRAVLASIRPAQAQLLILRNSGLSYKELAEAVDVKMSGIGTMLNRAEEEFRKHYLAFSSHEEEL